MFNEKNEWGQLREGKKERSWGIKTGERSEKEMILCLCVCVDS